jgi:hypothetical protein
MKASSAEALRLCVPQQGGGGGGDQPAAGGQVQQAD